MPSQQITFHLKATPSNSISLSKAFSQHLVHHEKRTFVLIRDKKHVSWGDVMSHYADVSWV